MKSLLEAYIKMKNVVNKQHIEEILVETSVPVELHHIPDSWDHHGKVSDDTMNKMNSALTRGAFTHFPLAESATDADPDVMDHLVKHGYDIKDYKAGIATRKITVGNPDKGIPLREKHVDEKIGSILDKTQASDDIKKSFMNDPIRSSSKGEYEKHVVISTTPLALAGMSTGTSWDKQSCMNIPEGAHCDKLQADSEHGTHVAYLVHSNDETAFKYGEPSNPIARIALKPYHDDDGDTIFRPENRTYGVSNTHFETAVNNWANKNYPAKEGELYTKNRRVYDDTGNDKFRVLPYDEIEKHIDNDLHDGNTDYYKLRHIDSQSATHAINHVLKSTFGVDTSIPENKHLVNIKRACALSKLTEIHSLNSFHISKLLNESDKIPMDDNNFVENYNKITRQSIAVRHGDKVSTQFLDNFKVNSPERRVTNKMLMNPKIQDRHIDDLEPSSYNLVRRSKIKPHHIDRVVAAYGDPTNYGMHRTMVDLASHLNSDHIHKTIEHAANRSVSPVGIILKSPAFAKEHHDAFFNKNKNNSNHHIIDAYSNMYEHSPYTTFKDYDISIPNAFHYMAKNPHLKDEDSLALKNEFMKNATGAKNPDAKSQRWINNVFGMGNGLISHNISKHLTSDDMKSLAEHNYRTNWEHPDDSNRYMDAIYDHALHLDKQISDHIDKRSAEDDDYDSDEDDHVSHMKSKIENVMENYAANIDNHIDDHVVTNGDSYKVDNWNELEKVRQRFDYNVPKSFYKFDHYPNPHTESNSYNHEHYTNTFSDLDHRLHDLEKHPDGY